MTPCPRCRSQSLSEVTGKCVECEYEMVRHVPGTKACRSVGALLEFLGFGVKEPAKAHGLYINPNTLAAGFEWCLVPMGCPSMADAPRHEDPHCQLDMAHFVDERGKRWEITFHRSAKP